MGIFLGVWQAELHHGWAPLTGHWAEWTLPFLPRLPSGLWIEGNPGPKFQKRRLNTRWIISRPDLKRKTYKCHPLSFLSGFLTIIMSLCHSGPSNQNGVSTALSEGHFRGKSDICGLYFHSLPPPTTYTLDKSTKVLERYRIFQILCLMQGFALSII